MKRIDIHYGGEQYSVGGRSLDELREEVSRGMGGPHWLKVNDGDGRSRAAYLLITPGVPIALVPVPDDGVAGDDGDDGEEGFLVGPA